MQSEPIDHIIEMDENTDIIGSISDSSSDEEDKIEDKLMSVPTIESAQLIKVELTDRKGPFSSDDACSSVIYTADSQSRIVDVNDKLDSIVVPEKLSHTVPRSNTNLDLLTIQKPKDINDLDVSAKRLRANSDLNKYKDRMNGSSSTARIPEMRETPEKWRNRLWPSKAITSFCRILLRCKPPQGVPGEKLLLGRSDNPDSQLQPHWKESDLPRIGVNFDSAKSHSAAFFLLMVEECRDSVTKSDDFEGASGLIAGGVPGIAGSVDPKEQSALTRGDARYSLGNNGWFDCEITGIVSESPLGKVDDADPRLGSVWVVSVAIIRTDGNNYNNNALAQERYPSHQGTTSSNNRSISLPKDSDFSGGDLMLLHSASWSTNPLLMGVIQPWDPDYDLKFGINFALNQSSQLALRTENAENVGTTGCASGNVVTTVNMLICVDHQTARGDPLGGWAATGSIKVGVRFSMAYIGNVQTSIRECQALMSLHTLNIPLRNALLNSHNVHKSHKEGNVAASAGSGAVSSGEAVSAASSSVATDVPSSTSAVSAATSVSSPRSGNSSEGVLSPSALRRQKFHSDLDKVFCPENVPVALWKTLSEQYNASQLKAIKMVCNCSPQSQDSPVSLLQGPPGTGKTKTILALVSVFLAGVLNPQKNGSTKIVAGSSFIANANLANKARNYNTANKDVPSNAGYGLPPLQMTNGNSSVTKPRVLLCAPSNTAVDELVYRLITQGVIGTNGRRLDTVSIIRIGHPCREEYRKINQNRVLKGSRNMGSNSLSGGLTTQEHTMLRVVEGATLDNLVELRRSALNISRDAGNVPGLKAADLRKQILENADVVCCTLSGAGSQPILELILRITGFKFDAVIIDEAAQAVEPSSLIPFKFNPNAVVMVGDPCQLPATVFSNAARRCNYSQSLFQRLHIAGCHLLMLETQYRMHPIIAEYPSNRFYNGKLLTDQAMIDSHSHDMPYHAIQKFRPFVFHDVAYGAEYADGSSTSNRDEANYILNLYEDLVRQYPEHKNGIGIIAPYRAQRRLLTSMFKERFGRRGPGGTEYVDADTEISTVDGFQGREKNIIIFSCVRAPTAKQQSVFTTNNNQYNRNVNNSNSSSNNSNNSNNGRFEPPDAPVGSNIGFLREWQRLNVAITRAKYSLWIVGHAATLRKDEEWRQLMDFVEAKGYLYDPASDRATHASAATADESSGGNANRNNQYNSNSNSQYNSSHHSNRNNDSRDNKRSSKNTANRDSRDRGDGSKRSGNNSNKKRSVEDIARDVYRSQQQPQQQGAKSKKRDRHGSGKDSRDRDASPHHKKVAGNHSREGVVSNVEAPTLASAITAANNSSSSSGSSFGDSSRPNRPPEPPRSDLPPSHMSSGDSSSIGIAGRESDHSRHSTLVNPPPPPPPVRVKPWLIATPSPSTQLPSGVTVTTTSNVGGAAAPVSVGVGNRPLVSPLPRSASTKSLTSSPQPYKGADSGPFSAPSASSSAQGAAVGSEKSTTAGALFIDLT